MTKLPLDENLSWRLAQKLQPVSPGSRHVGRAWVARRERHGVVGGGPTQRLGFMLVFKDDDYRQLGLLRGAPPKVLVLAIGNAGSAVVLDLPQRHTERIAAFDADPSESPLMLRGV